MHKQNNAIKIEDEVQEKKTKSKEKIIKEERLIKEEPENPDTPNVEDIVIMWTLMIFSHSLEVSQAQNRLDINTERQYKYLLQLSKT